MPKNRSKFYRFPENHWVVSFIVYAFHTTTFFQLGVYIPILALKYIQSFINGGVISLKRDKTVISFNQRKTK